MKKFALLAAVAAIAIAPQAKAEEFPYWYIGLDASVNQQADGDFGTTEASYDTGVGFNGAWGYRFLETSAAVELEVGYDKSDVDNGVGELKNNFVAINGIVDFPTGSQVSPYVGAGIGLARVDADSVTVNGVSANGHDTVPMYQAMVGVSYKPETMPRTELNVGYRYQGLFDDAEIGTTDVEFQNHALEVGAEFNF